MHAGHAPHCAWKKVATEPTPAHVHWLHQPAQPVGKLARWAGWQIEWQPAHSYSAQVARLHPARAWGGTAIPHHASGMQVGREGAEAGAGWKGRRGIS